MKKVLISILAICLMVVVLATTVSAQRTVFDDVKEGDWFYDAVMYCYDSNIIQGVGGGKFSPKSNMTRAQLVTLLSRLSGADTEGLGDLVSNTDVKGVKKLVTFKDVKSSDWYADYVGWGVQVGILNGYTEKDGLYFKPNNPISRQELAKLVVSYLNYIEYSLRGEPLVSSFKDASTLPSWSKEYIEALRLSGLVGGDKQGNFNPKSTATRAEVATIMMRFMESAPDYVMYTAEKEFVRDNTCSRHGAVDIIIDKSSSVNVNTLAKFLMDYMALPSYRYRIELDSNTVAEMNDKVVDNESTNSLALNLVFRITDKLNGTTTPEYTVPVTITKTVESEAMEPICYCPAKLTYASFKSVINEVKAKYANKAVTVYISDGFDINTIKNSIVKAIFNLNSSLASVEFEDDDKVLKEFKSVYNSLENQEEKKNAVTVTFKAKAWSLDDGKMTTNNSSVTVTLNLVRIDGYRQAEELVENTGYNTFVYDKFPTEDTLKADILANTDYFDDVIFSEYPGATSAAITELSESIPAGEVGYSELFAELVNTEKNVSVSTAVYVGVKKAPDEIKAGEDFVFVKDGKAVSTIVVSDEGSYQQWAGAEAIQKKILELSGVFVPIVREDRTSFDSEVLGNPVCVGECKILPSSVMGEATSYQYAVNTVGPYLGITGRTEGGHCDAAAYAVGQIVCEGNCVVIKSSSFGIFDRELEEAYHAFGDYFHTSYYGDPYSGITTAKEAYENEKIFNDIVDFGVKEIPFYSKGNSEEAVYYTKLLFKKFADAGICIRFYGTLGCPQTSDFFRFIKQDEYASRYISAEERQIILSAYLEFEDDILATDAEDYEARAKLCKDFIEYFKVNAPIQYSYIENAIKEICDTYGDVENIFQWGYYDEPSDYSSYMENQIIIETYHKYDSKQRPVYVNQNPLTNQVFYDGNDEYLKMSSFVDNAYFCYDRYPFRYDNYSYAAGIMDYNIVGYENPVGKLIILTEEEAKTIETTYPGAIHYDTIVGDNIMGDDSFYHNYEMNMKYAIDSSIDCGIILCGMKVGGDYENPDFSEITEDFAKWETNLIVAYNYRYYESYVYYPCHDYAMLQTINGEAYTPSWRWSLMRERNLYLNIVANLFTDNKLDAVFHLANEDGSMDRGVTKYYAYHGLGEIEGCDVIISFFDDGKFVLTDKRCDCNDGDAHEIVIHDFDLNTQYFDVETQTWLSASACPGLTLDGNTATIVMERASQLVFKK